MKYAVLLAAALTLSACAEGPKIVPQNTAATSNDRAQTAIAHTSENQNPPMNAAAPKRKWSRSGDPIDTTALDAAVTKADKDLKAKPNDEAAKKALASAYNARGEALTNARQYAAALGDFRKALKLDPANSDAKGNIAMIVNIYDGMGIEYPGEGQEPEPLRKQ